MGIVAALGDHLLLLDPGNTILRVENDDPCSRDIGKTGHGRFARITRGRCQDDDLLRQAVLLRRCRHQMRQNGKGHILEGDGGAVIQLEIIGTVRLDQRSDDRGIEFIVIRAGDAAAKLFFRKIRQIAAHDAVGQFTVIHPGQFFQ